MESWLYPYYVITCLPDLGLSALPDPSQPSITCCTPYSALPAGPTRGDLALPTELTLHAMASPTFNPWRLSIITAEHSLSLSIPPYNFPLGLPLALPAELTPAKTITYWNHSWLDDSITCWNQPWTTAITCWTTTALPAETNLQRQHYLLDHDSITC